MAEDRYRYEISWRSLMTGIVALSVCELLLLSLMLDGVPTSWLWWVLVVVVGGSLALASWLALATWRVRPIEIVVADATIDLPDGLAGTRRRRLEWSEVRGVRIVGRSAPVTRTRTREVLYLLHGDRYVVVMSELFASAARWEHFRARVLDAVKAVTPDIRIDIDGETVNGVAVGDEPSDAPDASASDARTETEADDVVEALKER